MAEPLRSTKELAADIEDWVADWNENPTPFVWHKTAEQILERLAGYLRRRQSGRRIVTPSVSWPFRLTGH